MWADKRLKQKWLLKYVLNSEETERKTQGLHVLKKLSGEEGPVVKLVTDGSVSIPAEFTPTALDQFCQSSDSDSPIQWDRCWIIVKKYSLKFLFTAALDTCSLRLLIDDFSFWASEEGFRLKEDPTPCLELTSVQAKIKGMWESQRQDDPTECSEAQSMEVSSVPLSALLSQMYKDSQVVSTQGAVESQSIQSMGPRFGLESAINNSKLEPECRPEITNNTRAETPQSLTEELIDIKRFVITSTDACALEAIPEWKPGYVAPAINTKATKATAEESQENSSSVMRQGIRKIINKTLAEECSIPDSGSSNSQQREGEESIPLQVSSNKPAVTNCNISVQVGDSLLSGPAHSMVQTKTVPVTKECCAQVGNSLLNNSEITQSNSQSQTGEQINLPSNFVFHPYFLGENSTNGNQHTNSAFKAELSLSLVEPCLLPRLQKPSPAEMTDKADLEEGSFVVSTQINRQDTDVPRPDFQMSPVTNTQTEPRLRECEMSSEASFITNDLSESMQTQSTNAEKKLENQKKSEIVMHNLQLAGLKQVMCILNFPEKTTENKTILSEDDKNREDNGSNVLPTNAYKSCAEDSTVSPSHGKSKTGVSSKNKEMPVTCTSQTSKVTDTVSTLSEPEDLYSCENRTDHEVLVSPVIKNSQENLSQSVLSNLGQKLSTTPESSSCGSGSQDATAVDGNKKHEEEKATGHEGSSLAKTGQAENGFNSQVDVVDSAEDKRLQQLANVCDFHKNTENSVEKDHTKRQRDHRAEGNSQINIPVSLKTPWNENLGLKQKLFMGWNMARESGNVKKFSSEMSPEARRLEMMNQVLKTSEAYKAQKENVDKREQEKEIELPEVTRAEDIANCQVAGAIVKSPDEDLIIEKVIRRKNTNSSGNTSISCTTSVVLKVEPVSESESDNDINKQLISKNNCCGTDTVQEEDFVGTTGSADRSMIVQVEVHNVQENKNNAIHSMEQKGKTEKDKVEQDEESPVGVKHTFECQGTTEESSGTEKEQNSASPSRSLRFKQKPDVSDDILTLDTSCAAVPSYEQKQNEHTTLSQKKSGVMQKRESKVSDSDEEGGPSYSRKISASVKKRVSTRRKPVSSEDDEDDEWLPSPAKQGRPKAKASQPRFSFSKTKSVSENIQDMLATKKSGQLDSSVLFPEKTPKGKSGHGKHVSQAPRSTKKHRLYNESMFLSEAVNTLESVAEEQIKEAEKVENSGQGRNRAKTKSLEKGKVSTLSTKGMENNQNINRQSPDDDNFTERKIMTKNPATGDQLSTKSPSQSSRSPVSCLFGSKAIDIQEEYGAEIGRITTLVEDEESTTGKGETLKHVPPVSTVVVVQGGNTFQVSQPVVVLEPIDVTAAGDVAMSEGVQQKLKELQVTSLNKSVNELPNLNESGTDSQVPKQGDSHVSVLESGNLVNEPSNSKDDNALVGYLLNNQQKTHNHHFCNDNVAEGRVSESDNITQNTPDKSNFGESQCIVDDCKEGEKDKLLGVRENSGEIFMVSSSLESVGKVISNTSVHDPKISTSDKMDQSVDHDEINTEALITCKALPSSCGQQNLTTKALSINSDHNGEKSESSLKIEELVDQNQCIESTALNDGNTKMDDISKCAKGNMNEIVTTDKENYICMSSSKSGEETLSHNKSVEIVPPTDESIPASVISPGDVKANRSLSSHESENIKSKKQKHCEKSVVNEISKLNNKIEESESVCKYDADTAPGQETEKKVTNLLQTTEDVHKSPVASETGTDMNSMPRDFDNSNNNYEATKTKERALTSVEKLLECSTVDDASLSYSSGKNLTYPTPDMSLQCAQRSGQCEGHLSVSQGHLEAFPHMVECDLEEVGSQDTDDFSIVCSLQKILDEEIQKEDEHKLLDFKFIPKTESAIRSYFGLTE